MRETIKTIVISVLVTVIVAGIGGFIIGNRYANQANAKTISAVKSVSK